MLLGSRPYYNYVFGTLGRTLESVRQSEFFQWFHLEQVERTPEGPGENVRFRPSGESFRDLCWLDALAAPTGEMVRIELVVRRAFIEGNQGLFAQDLVKSFLNAALPDACRDVLHDFMAEINEPGRNGETTAYHTFRGRHPTWREQTGWSRLWLANLPLPEGPVFLAQIGPNPKAPNAKLVQGPIEDDEFPLL
jgi:hypothetical protein